MPTQVQFRRGTTTQVEAFTGGAGEVVYDTEKKTLSVQDGTTPGGTYLATQEFANAAFNLANNIIVSETAAFIQANLAFDQANAANVLAQSAYNSGNATYTYAQSGYQHANDTLTFAESGYNKTNTVGILAQNAYDAGNLTLTYATSGYNKANAANVLAQSAYDYSNTIGTFAQSAYDKANSDNTLGFSAYNKANAANTLAQSGYDKANSAGTVAQSAYDSGNNTLTYATSGFNKANAANVLAQSAFDHGNNTMTFAQSGYDEANAANVLANSAYSLATDGYNFAASANVVAFSAYNKANSSGVLAQNAFDRANTKYNSSGGTISGNVDITGQANVTVRLAVGTGAYAVLPNLISQFTGTSDNYIQVNAQNLDGNGSADFVVTSNNGTDSSYYTDMGQAGSTYNYYGPNGIIQPNDSYLIGQGLDGSKPGSNLFIMATTASYGDIVFVQGGALKENEIARFKYGQGLVLENGTVSTDNATGSLVVQGGVGVQGSVNADSVYDNGSRIITVATSAGTVAQAGFNKANAANVLAQSAYDSGNTNYSNSITFAQAGFDKANAANVLAQSAYDSANNVFPQIQPAFNKANAANVLAQSAYDSGNNTLTYATSGFNKANAANVLAQSAYDSGNNTLTYATSGFNKANAANVLAQSAYDAGNNTLTYATAGFNKANAANVLAQSAYDSGNSTNTLTVAGFNKANAANVLAQSAYDSSNTKFASAGGTITGATHITNATQSTTDTNGALIVDGGVGIAKNLNVGGDAIVTGTLTVVGGTTTTSSSTVTYANPYLTLHDPTGNTWVTSNDGVDIGIMYEYYDANGAAYIVTGGSGNGTTATLTISDRFVTPVGEVITISGVTPSGFNGSFVVTAASAGSVSFLNPTNASVDITGAFGKAQRATQFNFTSGTWSSQNANVAFTLGSPSVTLPTGKWITVTDAVPNEYNGTYQILTSGPGYITYHIGNPNPGPITVPGKITLENRHAFSGWSNDTGYFEFYKSGNFDATGSFGGLYGGIKAGKIIASPPSSISAADLTAGGFLQIPSSSVYDVSTPTNGIVAQISTPVSMGIVTIASANANVHYTNSATLYIAGAPVAGNNVVFDSNQTYALEVATGNTLFGGDIVFNDSRGIVFNDGTRQTTNAATYTYSVAGFNKANAANVLAQSAYDAGNSTNTLTISSYNKANAANVLAQSAYDSGNNTYTYAQSGYTKANNAVQTGFVTISANGNSIASSSNNDTLTITAATANGINVLNPTNKTIDIGLRTTGVVAGGYGNTTSIPSITVDSFGRITSVSNNVIYVPPGTSIVANTGQLTANAATGIVALGLATTAVSAGNYGGSTQIPVLAIDAYGRITSASNTSVSTTISLAAGSGSGSVSGGGTLTLSGGTGITTSASGSTITITNSGVTSFDTNSTSRITHSQSTGAIAIDLATTAVTPASYNYTSLTVDAYGRITSASSGTPVTSFNGQSGAIVLSSANVTSALGYTPSNVAGDQFTGGVTATSLKSNTTITIGTSNIVGMSSNTYTTSGLTQVTIDSFATTSYRSAKYLASIKSSTNYHMIELNVIHDGASPYLAQYGEIFTTSSLGTFDVSITSGTLNLLFTPTNSTTTVNLVRTSLAV